MYEINMVCSREQLEVMTTEELVSIVYRMPPNAENCKAALVISEIFGKRASYKSIDTLFSERINAMAAPPDQVQTKAGVFSFRDLCNMVNDYAEANGNQVEYIDRDSARIKTEFGFTVFEFTKSGEIEAPEGPSKIAFDLVHEFAKKNGLEVTTVYPKCAFLKGPFSNVVLNIDGDTVTQC